MVISVAVHASANVQGKRFSFSLPSVRSSIESEPALVLGPLRSLEEQRQEQQLQEIQLRRLERERRAAEEDGGARDESPPVLEKADELTGPFHYEFSYWARSVAQHVHCIIQCILLSKDHNHVKTMSLLHILVQ